MSSTIPPELPKLPPVRESAEQALPSAVEGSPVEPSTPQERPPRGTRDRRARSSHEQPPQTGNRTPAQRRGATPGERPLASGAGSEGRIRYSDDGRRLSTAGHGLVVALLALVFGALLLAPGMHKASFNGQPGTKRDVTLALTAGLVHVSHALLLDRPRALVQDVMGRQSADQINVTIVAPPTTTERSATAASKTTSANKPAPSAGPKHPTRLVFTPKKRLRIWIAGDSLVIEPGYSIVRAAGASPVIQSVGGVDGHVGTGLTRPDVFNWFQEIAAQVERLKPNVVVLNFGGNDNHGYMTGLPPGTSIGDFASPSWGAEYLRRVRVVMDTINRAGATVVWIGLPIVSSPAESAEFDKLNAIVQRETLRRGPAKALFVDTYTMFAGANGGFTEYLQNANGDNVKVRASDGVHFDSAGGDMIARDVLQQLNKTFDLTSWRKHTSG